MFVFVLVSDHLYTSRPDFLHGKFIERIGTYNPNTDPSEFKVDEEAAKKWLANGAQPTEVVGKLFKAAGIEK